MVLILQLKDTDKLQETHFIGQDIDIVKVTDGNQYQANGSEYHKEDITIVNMYAPNTSAPNFIKQTLDMKNTQ
jgi:hypothetical protein